MIGYESALSKMKKAALHVPMFSAAGIVSWDTMHLLLGQSPTPKHPDE